MGKSNPKAEVLQKTEKKKVDYWIVRCTIALNGPKGQRTGGVRVEVAAPTEAEILGALFKLYPHYPNLTLIKIEQKLRSTKWV